jgi:hypothetical protein
VNAIKERILNTAFPEERATSREDLTTQDVK